MVIGLVWDFCVGDSVCSELRGRMGDVLGTMLVGMAGSAWGGMGGLMRLILL